MTIFVCKKCGDTAQLMKECCEDDMIMVEN